MSKRRKKSNGKKNKVNRELLDKVAAETLVEEEPAAEAEAEALVEEETAAEAKAETLVEEEPAAEAEAEALVEEEIAAEAEAEALVEEEIAAEAEAEAPDVETTVDAPALVAGADEDESDSGLTTLDIEKMIADAEAAYANSFVKVDEADVSSSEDVAGANSSPEEAEAGANSSSEDEAGASASVDAAVVRDNSVEVGEKKKRNFFARKWSKIKRRLKKAKKCMLFTSVFLSMFIVVIVSAIIVGLSDYSWNVSWERPVFASIIMGEKDEILLAENEPEAEGENGAEEVAGENVEMVVVPIIETIVEEEETETETETETEEEEELAINPELAEEYLAYYGEEPFTLEEGSSQYYVSWTNTSVESPYYVPSDYRPVSSVYDYQTVDASYFANSIFIGDSRVEGLHDYSGWEETTFCYKVGLTIFTLFDSEIKTDRGSTSTLEEVLAEKPYDNVFLMIGINELGKGTVDNFAESYSEAIAKIREYQPDARIVIMGIMYETKEYSDGSDVYTNDNINAKNAAIAKLANGTDIFYLDMNPCISDDSGVLNPEFSFDGVHLKAQYYSLWTDFMYKHGF